MARHLRYVTITALACLLLGVIGMAGGERGTLATGGSVSAGDGVPDASTESVQFRPGEVPWLESVSGRPKGRSPFSSHIGLTAFCVDISREMPAVGAPGSCEPGIGPEISRYRNDSPRSPVMMARRPR